MRKVILIACFLALAGQVRAGPWLRAEGERFLSFSAEWVDTDPNVFVSSYFEYGATAGVTLGFDLGTTESDFYKAVIFAKRALPWTDGPLRISVELGAGVTDDAAVIRPGLSLGRGFTLGARSGWISIDSLLAIEVKNGEAELSTDVTLGLNLSERAKLILQVQSGDHPWDPEYLKFAPSYVYEHRPGRHLELGLLAGIENAADYGVKLGVWRRF